MGNVSPLTQVKADHQPVVAVNGNAEGVLARLYTPQQIAEAWQVDESTVRRLFVDQPGVLKLGRASGRRGKRQYVTLRIPAEVLARVQEERSR